MLLEMVDNFTPFTYFVFEKMGKGRHRFDVIIVKAACELKAGSEKGITLLPETAPIHLADEHFGEPERTSLRKAGDTLLYKQSTDVFIAGEAKPSTGRHGQWAAEIELRDPADKKRHWKQHLRLHGSRYWQWTLLKGWHLSDPEPPEPLPMRYELAFGGRYPKKGEWVEHDANPVGRGFLDPDNMDRDVRYPVPQIELFDHPVRKPGAIVPVPGLGPIPRFWSARRQYAGTYDAAWKAESESVDGPDYPQDFDSRFFQSAHPSWVVHPPLQGGEQLTLRGFDGENQYTGRLPTQQLQVSLLLPSGEPAITKMVLDTVEIALSAKRVYLTWRLPVPHQAEARAAVISMLTKANIQRS